MPKETNEIELLLSCKATGREQLEMFSSSVKDTDAQANQLLGTLGKFATVGGIAMFAKKSIQAFSDLEETTSKFRVVFAGLEKQADAAVQSLTKSYGASIMSARQMLSGTGDLLAGFDFDKEQILELSVLTAKLGSDLASFSNYEGGAERATWALTKAMVGETEMAKMLGIVVRQEEEDYKKLFKEIKATTGATDAQARALTTLRLAYQQSPNAIGDFERTMNSIANRGRMLQNEALQAYANIGEHMSGQFNALQGIALDLLKTFNGLDSETRRFITIAGETAGVMIALKTANSLRMLASSAANKAAAGSIAILNQEAVAVKNTASAYVNYNAVKMAKKARSSALAAGKSPITAEAMAMREYNKEMSVLAIRSNAAANALQIRNQALSLGASRAEANALTRAFIAQQKPIILAQERLARMPGILRKVHAGFVSANSAVKGMAISVAGLAKSFAPMLVMGVAMAGIDRLWRSDEISNAKILRGKEVDTNRTISKNESRVSEMEKERKMLEEYYNLAKLPDRDKAQNERLSSITDELTKKYSFLNLERADGNKVLDISIEKQKEMLRLLEQQHKLEKGVMAKENAMAYEEQAKAILKSMEVNTFAQGAKTVLKDLWDNMFSLNPDMARSDLASFVKNINFSDIQKLTEARDMALAGGLDEEAEKFTKIIDLIKKANELRKSGTLEEKKKREEIAAASAEQIKALEALEKHKRETIFDLIPDSGAQAFRLLKEESRLQEMQQKYTEKDGKVKTDKESVKEYYAIEKQLYDLKIKRFKLENEHASKPFSRNNAELTELQNIYSRFAGDTPVGRKNIVNLQKEQLANYADEIKRLSGIMNDESGGVEKQMLAQERILELTKERASLEKTMAIEAFADIQKRIEAQAKFSSEVFNLINAVRVNTVESVSANSIKAMQLQSRSFSSDRWQSTALSLQKDTANQANEIKRLVSTIKSINSELNSTLLQILSKVDLIGVTSM
jgi:hypothetical protein